VSRSNVVLVGRMGHQRLEALRQLRMRQMGGSTAVSRSIERVNEGASDSTDWVNCQTVRPNGTTKIIGDQPRGAWVTSQGQAASGRRVHAPPLAPVPHLVKEVPHGEHLHCRHQHQHGHLRRSPVQRAVRVGVRRLLVPQRARLSGGAGGQGQGSEFEGSGSSI